MDSEHSSDSTLWRLDSGRAMRLPTQMDTRRLRVREGRLWLTTFGSAHEQAADVWLGPGDEMTLPDGGRWVAEAWPKASFEILVTPASQAKPAALQQADALPWQRWLGVLQRRTSHA